MGLTERTYTDNVTVITAQNLNDIQDAIIALETAPSQVLSEAVKQALLQLAQKVAYIDDQGQTYYQDLYNALYPPAALVSINAVFTQGSTVVYDTASLDSLKSMLVVTGTYDDATTATIPSTDYTLSGTLTAGTSTITVTYSGKTDTFTVNVTAAPTLSSISAAYTQSGTVYDTDTLDSLKTDLVVTATYSDSSTQTVPAADYTLSGTLTAGTSTITVAYGGKTATFAVTVTHDAWYVTDGLLMLLDGEKNGTNGTHETTLNTWVDQSGNGYNWTNSGATVNAKSIAFANPSYLTMSQTLPSGVKTIEIVMSTPHTGGAMILSGYGDAQTGNIQMGTGDGMLFHTGTNSSGWSKITANWSGIHAYSCVGSSRGYRDGADAKASISVTSSWTNSTPRIGLYAGSGSSQFVGEIYCIRLYNRELTEAEVLENYAVDAARFGIGG